MTKQEAQEFIERMQEAGDDWTEELVMDVYGNDSLEDATRDRLSLLEMQAQNLVIAKEHGLL
jgi:hypothetical protein|nr:MAG TPA: Nif11 domain [Caudoviricetes sp.]